MNGGSVRVAILTAYYEPAFLGGGPIRTLAALSATAPPDHQLSILTSDCDLGATERLPVPRNKWVERGDHSLYYASVDSWRAYARALLAVRRRRPHVLYINSLFEPRFSIIPLILHKLGWLRGTVLVAPRGELGRGALGVKPTKKAMFLRVAKLIGLHRDVSWHASSAEEAEDIRSRFPEARPLIRADETDLPERAIRYHPPVRDRPRMVFLGRVVPVKGLDILIRGLKYAGVSCSLDVVGADEDVAYAALCRRLVAELPAGTDVHFLGPTPHDRVRATLNHYDALLLPTLGENFGHVIAEALSCGIPVLCSANTPWTSVISEAGGAIVAPNDSESWGATVAWFSSLTAEERRGLKSEAADAYDRWRSTQTERHIFTLLQSQMSGA